MTMGGNPEVSAGETERYLHLYDLERYLFETVRERFHRDGELNALDFFCIVIWKANRAKTKVARRLLSKGHQTLQQAVTALTREIAGASAPKDRLRTLVEGWGFRVPMATAVLTVLFPDEFTVCDVRVADAIGAKVPEMYGNFETLWHRCREFHARVEQSAPADLSLRDKDRYLWGRSFHDQLEADLKGWETALIGTGADELRAFIGGFPGTSYQVELAGDTIIHRSLDALSDHAAVTEVRPTPERWSAFWCACEKIGVWNWKASYHNHEVLDGTQWELSMRVGSSSIKTSGSNAYPDPEPTADPVDESRSFVAFRAALRKLLGGLRFK
jgi:hypothetical protein